MQRITITSSQLQEQLIILTQEQQHYLCRVLRLRLRDRFIAMDGRGKWWLAQLMGEQAEILSELAVDRELPIGVTLMLALPKGSGFDDVVRMCTELGVTCIAPVLSDRTLLNPSPQKLERWRKIATEAAEQSERAIVPTILSPVSFQDAIANTKGNQRYICEARGDYPHLKTILDKASTTDEIIIAIGPEGGWTEKELEIAQNAGFQPISLGRRILRAVTAPIAALSVIAAAMEYNR